MRMVLICISFVVEKLRSWFSSSLAVFCFTEINQNMTLLARPYMVSGQHNASILSVLGPYSFISHALSLRTQYKDGLTLGVRSHSAHGKVTVTDLSRAFRPKLLGPSNAVRLPLIMLKSSTKTFLGVLALLFG